MLPRTSFSVVFYKTTKVTKNGKPRSTPASPTGIYDSRIKSNRDL